MVNFLAEDPMSPFALHHNFDSAHGPAHAGLNAGWAPSLDPKSEERMPNEFRHWRRWSNHFDKEQDFKLLEFDMGSECPSCGSTAWQLIDTDILRAIECRDCGHTPTESHNNDPRTRVSRVSRHSRSTSKHLSRTYTEEISEVSENEDDSVFSSMTEASGIVEQDFASLPTPRTLAGHRNTGIQSVRQSVFEPAPPKPRWFETNKSMTFQFKLTPRSRASSAASTASGSSAATSASTATPASASSSRPPGFGKSATDNTRGIPIAELDDATAWQRLLASALFLMKEEHVPAKDAPPKIIDLGLLNSRNSGGKHLAMKHHSSKDHEAMMQKPSAGQAKRVLWKIVVKPANAPVEVRSASSAVKH
ncbi:hypothetical protein EJ08DRAFT_136430 [Tothia fuscella]|uniref:Uncharacterized protein n=1 Tax=Tothia fuscella TaxID=1048955 RepID=A0A9P4NVM9_9PEZI|nr:hypothetical protein EJ08DRAFT_136430 [Tothia fuscella]